MPAGFVTSTTPATNPTVSFPVHAAQTSIPPNEQNNDPSSHVFTYYFVIIGLVVIAIFFLVFLVSRRKKNKALLQRNNGQTALARDVQSFSDFRQRNGPRRVGVGLSGMNMVVPGAVHRERLEGLDERGEAPPAYVEGDKPPSLRSEDIHISSTLSVPVDVAAVDNAQTRVTSESASLRSTPVEDATNLEEHPDPRTPTIPAAIATGQNQEFEPSPISRSTTVADRPSLGPPTYYEAEVLTRPPTAATPLDRLQSTTRLIASDSRSSS